MTTVEMVIAILAVFVAACALGVSFQQLNMQRRHNRLSVKPVPSIETINLVQKVSISLRNIGPGPCFISGFKVVKDDKSFRSVFAALPKRPESVKWDRYTPAGDFVIAAGESALLVSYTNRWRSEESGPFLDEVKAALNGLVISFSYTDVYGSEFERAQFPALRTPPT